MAVQGWQRQYLDALLRSRTYRVAQFETLEYFSAIVNEPADGVQELLLHRLISGLDSVSEAIKLLDIIQKTSWKKYGPRILARIGDTEAVLKLRPDLEGHFQILRERTGYTTYSIKDWRIIGDGTNLLRPDAPVWSGRTTAIQKLVEQDKSQRFGIEDIAAVLQHYFEAGIRVFQLAIITFVDEQNEWARVLHQVLTAPYLEINLEPHVPNSFVSSTPAALWTPYWRIATEPDVSNRWNITEVHTGQKLHGLGSAGIYDQISVILSVSGLLRDGINLCPIDNGLVRAMTPSHPVWGFRRREYSAARTTYQADDVRALALAFLDKLPATQRVSMFRSRVAMRLVGEAWVLETVHQRFQKRAVIINTVRAAQLLGTNRFSEVIDYIDQTSWFQPAFRFF